MLPRFRPLATSRDILRSADLRLADIIGVEKVFAEAFGFAEAVYFPYGRTAVSVFLQELGVRGQVVLSPFNCTALGSAIAAAECSPFYVDTELDGFAEDPTEFAHAMQNESVVAGIAVAPWGARSHVYDCKKPVLYDYALGGLEAFRPPMKESDGVLYSVGWGKPLSTLKGAFLCTERALVAERWRAMRSARCHAKSSLKDSARLLAIRMGSHPWLFGIARDFAPKTSFGGSLLGTESLELSPEAYRIPSSGVLSMIPDRIRRRHALRLERQRQINLYQNLLRPLSPGILLPEKGLLSHFPIRLSDAQDLHFWLLESGIFTSRDLFSRLLSEYPEFDGETHSTLDRAKELCAKTLHLPLYHGLSAGRQEAIVRSVVRWTRRNTRASWWRSKTNAAYRASGT